MIAGQELQEKSLEFSPVFAISQKQSKKNAPTLHEFGI